MSLIKKINRQEFIDEFYKFDESYKDKYTYEGKCALFNYLEDTGEDIELDIIAICCNYTEYESLKDLQEYYPKIKDMEDLENHTTVIPLYNYAGIKMDRFIIKDF